MGEALPGGELSADALADRVEQQTENYRDLIEIGSGSAEEALDGDALLALVQRKLEVMERVDRLEKDLAPVKEGWPAYLDRLPEDRRAEIEKRMGRLARTLAELVEQEEAQQARIGEKLGLVRGELGRVARGKKIQQAYGKARPRESRFVDRRR